MKTFLYSVLMLFMISSCRQSRESCTLAVSNSTRVDSINAQSPYFAVMPDGSVILSWVRVLADSSSSLCYTITRDGRNFSPVVSIPGTENLRPHGENLPRIIAAPNGEMVAAWGERSMTSANKYAGSIFYARSRDEGRSWTAPRPLVSDTSGRDQRYFDMALLPGGNIAMIWLDDRKPEGSKGSALYFAKSSHGGDFGEGKKIAESCCECCRTDLYVDRRGGIHAVYRAIIRDSIRDMSHITSHDGGKTFSAPSLISEDNWVINGCPHTGPAITENDRGLHFAWYTGAGSRGCFYSASGKKGPKYSGHDRVSGKGSHPQIASLGNGNILIAWDEGEAMEGEMIKKIGLQQRDPDGKTLQQFFLPGGQRSQGYPVLISLDNGDALVAYTEKQENGLAIFCVTLSDD